MIRAVFFALATLLSCVAQAHVGSPDLFYSGEVGPYPARITIRMPGVIPGRAEISVRVDTADSVEVAFLPLYAKTAIKNAPPPESARLVDGETSLYSGELWLMSFGAYSAEVRVNGPKGEGSVQIPLTSVATRQLPMPSLLGKVLSVLALTLFVGGIGIAFAAAREATLAPSQTIGKPERLKGFIAAASTAVLLVCALIGGRQWWKAEEGSFRRHLREGAWPDLIAQVHSVEGQRILELEVGAKAFQGNSKSQLIPDHGKLMHLFLIGQGGRQAFAHLHPVRKKGNTFEVAVPPLPEGGYTVFCDLTFEGGSSSTASAAIVLPPEVPAAQTADLVLAPDPDDSWATYPTEAVPAADVASPVYRLADGTSVAWKSQKPLRIRQDASLRFEVTDPAGQPLALEPYMGMLSHAAVLRKDGAIFAHLHPTGNYSMAAQTFFARKLAKETSADTAAVQDPPASEDHSMHHNHSGAGEIVSSVYLPYEFPEPGDYRIWVQFKAGERILTAAFDARVTE